MSYAMKTPRSTIGSRIPRTSTALKPTSNIPRPSLTKDGRKSIRPENIFKSQPNTTKLKERQLPPEYQRHPIKLESKNIGEIYNYCFKIAGTFFTPAYAQMLFPSALSTEKTVVVGNKKLKDSTSKVPDYSRDLTKAFDFLSDLAKNKMSTFISLTDFMYLYPSIVIRVSSQEACVTKALFFVKKILDFDLPERNAEFYVLFSALMSTQIRTPVVVGILKQVVGALPKVHPKILRKIEKGASDSDSVIADICIGAMQQIGAANEETPSFVPKNHIQLTEITDPKTAVLTLNTITELATVEEPAKLVRDILITMQKFQQSMPVILATSQCLLKHIEKCCPIEHAILGQIIAVLFSTLNFTSDGSDDSLDAKMTVQSLIDSIIQHENNRDLIEAAKSSVHFMNGSAIDLLTSKFSEIGMSPAEFEQFDAMVTEYKREKLEKSINKLIEPDSIFDEMDRIINDEEDLTIYPLHLQDFLQRTYYLYKREAPEGMDERQLQLAKEMVQDYESMKSSNKIPDELSPEFLQSQLETIQKEIHNF